MTDPVQDTAYWSGSPYELLIIPRNHELHLADASDDAGRADGSSTDAHLDGVHAAFDERQRRGGRRQIAGAGSFQSEGGGVTIDTPAATCKTSGVAAI